VEPVGCAWHTARHSRERVSSPRAALLAVDRGRESSFLNHEEHEAREGRHEEGRRTACRMGSSAAHADSDCFFLAPGPTRAYNATAKVERDAFGGLLEVPSKKSLEFLRNKTVIVRSSA
jgi:hypothetical protein